MTVKAVPKMPATRYLNSPIGLNPVDDHILKQIPETAKCGVVVGAGDGRLTRAISDKLKGKATIYNVEHREFLHKYLEDLGPVAKDPWDFSWYEAHAKKNKGFDFVIFDNIQKYWSGNLHTYQLILQLLKPDGGAWMSFYNSTTLYEIGRHIPPLLTGFERLANPQDLWPRMDLASWMIYFNDVGLNVDNVWGMLQQDAYEYCKEEKKEEVEWSSKGFGVTVRDVGDAFILGAPIICLKLSANTGDVQSAQTRFLGIPYNASMLQAVLYPFEDPYSRELGEFRASVEAHAQQYEGEDESNLFLDFFIKQIEDFKEVKNVLIMGCGWGADAIGIKKLKPDWNITGIEESSEVLAQGAELLKQHKIKAQTFNPDEGIPFEDDAFDLVLSLRYFSQIYHPLALHLAKEMLRVSSKGIAHFEDYRGPELSMFLKSYSIPNVYKVLGTESEAIPLKMNDQLSGMYVLKVKK